MPVEMTYEVGDMNYLLNALPRMMLLMLRDGYTQKDIEKVTNLSSQALTQERGILLGQGFIEENGNLSDMARAVLDIYEFEDSHKEENKFYRDMVRHLLLPIDNMEIVKDTPDKYAWVDWPEHYDETEILQNASEAKKRVFRGYEHLLEYYDIDFPLTGAYSKRKHFAKLCGKIKLINATELTIEKAEKNEESCEKVNGIGEVIETEELKTCGLEDKQNTIELGIRVAVSAWHICASWQFESGQEYCKEFCLLPWGEIYDYSNVVEANSSMPRLHYPNEFSSYSELTSTFVEYMWNNEWLENVRSKRMINLKILEPSESIVQCSLVMEDKPL